MQSSPPPQPNSARPAEVREHAFGSTKMSDLRLVTAPGDLPTSSSHICTLVTLPDISPAENTVNIMCCRWSSCEVTIPNENSVIQGILLPHGIPAWQLELQRHEVMAFKRCFSSTDATTSINTIVSISSSSSPESPSSAHHQIINKYFLFLAVPQHQLEAVLSVFHMLFKSRFTNPI